MRGPGAGSAEQRRLSHEGFRTRFDRASSKLCVENVGRGFPTAETLLDGWRRFSAEEQVRIREQAARFLATVA